MIDYLIIKISGLFDPAYYLLSYPDVRVADIDPLMHFVRFGWKEGRNPSYKFDTSQYLINHPDVLAAGINPLSHYIKHGNMEGRKLTTTPSEINYNDYDDLSFQNTYDQYTQQFLNFPPKAVDIIIFPILDWDFRFQRPQQLARQFAALGHRVFYLKIGEHYRKNKAPLIKKIEENLYSVHLIGGEDQIPFESTLSDNNVNDLDISFSHLVEALLIKSAIIKVDLPFWRKIAIKLRDCYRWKLIYDCMDLHSGFSSTNKQKITDEEILLRESDAILASSNYLYDFVKQYNPHPILVPNAADYEFFHQATQLIEIDEIKDLVHPIIGYYGAISYWFDANLIMELASDRPDWTFLLIGSTNMADLNPLKGLKNIHLLGEKPYDQIPSFLSNFDVCIIPFKKTPLTEATNPVKLFEYLSAGKPVVSTKLNEISNYEEYTRLAETKTEWENAIQDSLEENKTIELISKRLKFAQENTWEKRTSKIRTEIIKLVD